MPNELITAFIIACLGGLVVICGYFVKTWIENLGGTITRLGNTVEELTSVVHEVKQEQAVMRIRNKHLLMEIRELQATSCQREDCPSKETSPGMSRYMPRTRLTDLVGDPSEAGERDEFGAFHD